MGGGGSALGGATVGGYGDGGAGIVSLTVLSMYPTAFGQLCFLAQTHNAHCHAALIYWSTYVAMLLGIATHAGDYCTTGDSLGDNLACTQVVCQEALKEVQQARVDRSAKMLLALVLVTLATNLATQQADK